MNDKKEHPEGLSRRGLLKTAGIVGAGLAAGSQIIKPGMAIGARPVDLDLYFREPGNPVLTEFLYDPDSGVILGSGVNFTGEPTMGTSKDIKNAWVFLEFDNALHENEKRETGIEFVGEKGKFRIRNGKLERNSNASQTLPITPNKPF